MELELKFRLTPDAAKGLLGSELSGVEPTSIRSLYFDTERRALRAAGFSLRVRNTGGRRVQTLKGLSGVERFEHETPLDGPGPDLSFLADTPVADAVDGNVLVPLFDTRVRRFIRTIDNPDGSIELALDHGEITAGGKSEPICELELELKSGPSARLFELAERLDGDHKLALSFVSKAERGYALADGEMSKAPAPTIPAETPAREAFRRLAQADLATFEINVRRVQAGDSLDAVHQARVSLRRLRVVVRAFREMVDDGDLASVEQALRGWAERFGEARNLDVFIEETFRPLARHEPGAAAFGRRLLSARNEAREVVRRGFVDGAADAFLLSTTKWVLAGDWAARIDDGAEGGRTVGNLAPGLLDAVWKGFRKRGKGLDWSDGQARHRLRIQAKKLRYLGDALGTAAPRPKGFEKRLRRFQDAAGRLNDLDVAPALIRRVLGGKPDADALFAAGEVIGEARAQQRKLIRKARKAYVDLLSRGPYWR